MKHQIGNILDNVKQGAILQQVNAQGVMGSGIAKEIRAKWPVVWQKYSEAVPNPTTPYDSEKRLGTIIPVEVEPGLWVINIVGQQYFGRGDNTRYTSYDALDKGLAATAEFLRQQDIRFEDIHHPMIGCGLGGASWSVVTALIEDRLDTCTTLWLLPTS